MTTPQTRLRTSPIAALVKGVVPLTFTVVPVVLVKPGIGGFVPTDGYSVGNTWGKSDVKPVLLVKQRIGGFVPTDGSSIGNTWLKDAVVPVALVEASPLGGFTSVSEESSADSPARSPASTPVIESQIDGDFEGWEGETIVKLVSGQIWQQTEYHYEYHYAFMPKVIIYKPAPGYKMKVEGTDSAVGVTRLK